MEMDAAAGILAHYGAEGTLERVRAALALAGLGEGPLTADDLAMLDQLHTGGRTSSRALARLAGVGPGTRVVDLGGGIGGPARMLAAELGCDVTVIDLSAELCRLGHYLTARSGLTDRVRFAVGSAPRAPAADGAFDLVWTQHAQMNIVDKAGLYREVERLLRPGGRFAFHEVMAGPVPDPSYPLPWATDPSASFLVEPEDVRALLAERGFHELAWCDRTADAVSWFQQAGSRSSPSPPVLGLHLILGSRFPEMARNARAGIERGRLAVIEALFERP